MLIAATFLVYWPALRNGFVWDDTALVLRDPLIRSWRLIPEGFRHFLFLDATASDFYRPLQRLTFTADYALYGFGAPWGWHLTSICLHAAAAVALLLFAQKLIAPRDGRLAFAAALIWAVHPLQTSAVTYIAGRADLLAALFGFSGLALALASLDNGPRARLATFVAGGCFLGALLSKESGIVALLIWFLILVWRRAAIRTFGKWLAVAGLVLGIYLDLRSSAEHTPPPAPPPTPLAIRPILAARAAAEYAGLLIAPLNLRMERDVTTLPQATPEATRRNAQFREYQTLLGVLLIVGFAAWWRRAWRTAPEVALCLAAGVLAYLPVSNLFSLNATVAEHWLYLPGAFLFLAALLSMQDWLAHRSVLVQRSAVAALALWVAFLGGRTALQQSAWRDQRTFLEHTIATGGDTARMRINLGNLESAAGHHDAALAQFRLATARAPELAMAWFGLANAAIRARDFPAAHAALEKTQASSFLKADVLQARAVLEYLETGRDTGDVLRQTVEAAPHNWSIRKRYLEHLDERGQTGEAARQLGAFLEKEAFRAESWLLLASFLDKLHQPDAAVTAYQQAAERDVRDAVSRTHLPK
ncbi:MAG: protein O-mannosyl-transferase [Chthoniobacter sp.]|nr:protein O-mannosyl-transferase [Chthoniobacter sp.]